MAAAMVSGCGWLGDTAASAPDIGGEGEATIDLVQLDELDDAVTVVRGDASEQALATSVALWRSSPLVVVAPLGDAEALVAAVDAAVSLAAPLLVAEPADDSEPATTDPELAAELERLGSTTVLSLGEVRVSLPDGVDVVTEPAGLEAQPLAQRTDVIVLTADTPDTEAAQATARAAGAVVVPMGVDDPRDSPEARQALSANPDAPVLALGSRLEPSARLEPLVQVAASGVELPGGGQTLFPGRRLVALYGHPQTTALGALGEQAPAESVTRARELAAMYQPFSAEPVVPAFEVIATVASGGPGPDGNYSNETPIEVLRPYVDAAAEAGVYVVIDLQPGRTDFVTQAQQYRELLLEPHVGLALDPEWRLEPDQVHLRQIGSVDGAEIEATADWLAELVRENALPQKLLLLHQFQQRMIRDRASLDTRRDELAVLVQMDGDGAPGDKLATWEALLQDAPEGLSFGWKNFYDEDTPTMSPEATMANTPTPWWVSYQ